MNTTSQVEVSQLERPLLWVPVCALAALYGMFALGWMVYRVHLPGFVAQVGFSEQAVPLLLLMEALLTIAIEPIAGAWSDRTHQQRGSRFPLITLGVVASSLIFVMVPTVLVFTDSTPMPGWVLIVLLLAWAVAMSLLRSPAIALLKRYAPPVRLPQAASLLTFAAGITGAITPLAGPFVLNLGAPAACTIAALLTLLSAIWLRWANPITLTATEPVEHFNSAQAISLPRLGTVFGLGLGATLALRLAIETFPKVLSAQVPGLQPPVLIALVFMTMAIAAFPVGKFAVRQGNRRTMMIGLAIAVFFLGLMGLTSSTPVAIVVALGLGVAFSLITNGTIPFALVQVPPNRAGLGVGMFFAGVAAASSLMLGVLSKPDFLAPTIGIALGVVALLLTGGCLLLARRRSPKDHG